MCPPSVEQARRAVLEACRDGLAGAGLTPETAGDDLDLREAGVIDSLGFVELIAELEERLGVALDLDALPAERLTVVGALAELAAASPDDAAMRDGSRSGVGS